MASSAAGKRKLRKRLGLGNRGGLAGYMFVAPSLVFLSLFVVLPVMLAFCYSLTDYDLMRSPRFAGFKTYLNLFDDVRYPRGVANMIMTSRKGRMTPWVSPKNTTPATIPIPGRTMPPSKARTAHPGSATAAKGRS